MTEKGCFIRIGVNLQPKLQWKHCKKENQHHCWQRKKALLSSCNDFVTKPINASILSKILNKNLMLKVLLQYNHILLQEYNLVIVDFSSLAAELILTKI